jgi:hypothetical protein
VQVHEWEDGRIEIQCAGRTLPRSVFDQNPPAGWCAFPCDKSPPPVSSIRGQIPFGPLLRDELANMEQRWFWRRSGERIRVMARADATPEDRRIALDARGGSLVLDELLDVDPCGGVAHARTLLEIADLPPFDARLYSRADLKRVVLRRLDGLLIMVGDPGLEGPRTGSSPTRTPGNEVPTSLPAEQLAREVMGDRVAIHFDGQSYRFVAATVDWTSGVGKDYRVLSVIEARATVGRMSARIPQTAQEKGIWARVADRLSDGRGGAAGRLLLLRHAPEVRSASRPVEGPALTPSQLRARTAAKHWIEIKLVYEDGRPFEGSCTVALPGGRTAKGPPDKTGLIRIDGLDPGECTLSSSAPAGE